MIGTLRMNMGIGNYRGWMAIAGGVIVHLTIGTLYTFGKKIELV